MVVKVVGVVVVADLEEHFDADMAERGEPHCAAVEDFDDVGTGGGDGVEQAGEIARAVENQNAEHHITAVAYENVFEHASEQVGVDVAAAQDDADAIVRRDVHFAGENGCEAGGTGAFDDEAVVLTL